MKEVKVEKAKEEPKAETPVEKDAPAEEAAPEKKKDDFIPTKAKLEGEIKVVDKIDLSQLNQRTRPPKKSKEERKKEREARDKQRKPDFADKKGEKKDEVFKPNRVRLNGPKVVDKIELKEKTGDNQADANKPKRKRIRKDNKKVDISNNRQQQQHPGNN